MAILPIAHMGDPVLLRRAAPVDDPAAAALRRLVADMIETMDAAPGVGLAAPQIGVSLRVIVFRVPPERASDAADDPPRPTAALINPEIVWRDTALCAAWEGCLSIPGLRGMVPRPARIRYRGFDGEGRAVEAAASGFHARVVQHEFDHLDGILYPMRMTDLATLSFTDTVPLAPPSYAAAPPPTEAGP